MQNEFLKDKIKLVYSELTKREKELGDKLLKLKIDFNEQSITRIATLASVSPSLINRFSIKLGYKGFKDFAAVMRQQSEFKNKYGKIISVMSADTIYSIALTERGLNYEEMILLSTKIFEKRNVIFYASDFAYRICQYHEKMYQKINIKSRTFNIDSDFPSIFPDEKAVHIFVTLKGDNKGIQRAYNKLKTPNSFFAVITSDKKTILDEIVNVRLHSEFFQSNSIHQFELPIVAKSVLDYILNVVFIHTYNKDSTNFSEMIGKISK